ncbi:MAG TPA: hypothetical protein VFO19_11630, partial [Vicinamibacterales bacterium]|nr:hypothetical protein [Vicinamibacterales bacterium]
LHNYTVWGDLVALPVQPIFGVIGAFNFVYLLYVALAGWGACLLAYRVTGARTESVLAGVAFACAPFLVARSLGHFSLVAAAPLPFFLYWLDRTWESMRWRDAAMTGACVAWAAGSDPYYAVYCVGLGLAYAASKTLRWSSTAATAPRRRAVVRALDVTIALALGLAILIRAAAGGALTIGGVTISMRSLYTPMLIVAILALVRAAAARRVRVHWAQPQNLGRLAAIGAAMVTVTSLLMAPQLIALVTRAAQGEIVTVPVLWRSSAPGVDALSFLVPNPAHPLAPAALSEWLAAQPGGYIEQVASLPWVALIVIAAGWRLVRFRPAPLWTGIALGAAWLSLGPFIRIAGLETFLPTPWALARYLPLLGAARMPGRMVVLVSLALSVIFAAALAALIRRNPPARTGLLAIVTIALAVELWPAPRPLYAASIPAIYRTVASDPRDVRVLELPLGIRDGLGLLGDSSALPQFYQTAHRKRIIGGYLSRVSTRSKEAHLREPVLKALIELSEGRALDAELEARARADARAFVDRVALGYVVIDRARVSDTLHAFATDALGLSLVGQTGDRELYVPR